jgi:glycine/D-amino acid oxidase-like deaminating enzyme
LLDVARARWHRAGVLEERWLLPAEGEGQSVWWCTGPRGFQDPGWTGVPGFEGLWQAVRGDVLTVQIPDWALEAARVGKRFLLPVGGGLYRWGATHESDVLDDQYRAEARGILENELREALDGLAYTVVDHRWGVRPASRTGRPLVVVHPDEPGWTLFNGFGGRGVSLVPRWLDRLLS